MKKETKYSIAIACALFFGFKGLSSLFSSGGVVEGKDEEITLYDINFVKTSDVSVPDVKLIRVNGDKEESFTLHDFKGKKPVIIHFWGTTCAPCALEFPHFVAFTQKYPEIEYIPLTIVSTAKQSKDVIHLGLKRFGGAELPLILDEQATCAVAFDVTAIPTSVFINKKGEVVGNVTGPIDWQDLNVQKLLLKIME